MRNLALLVATLAIPALAHAAGAPARPLVVAEAPEICTQVYQPVCGTDPGGKRVTYSNACFARMAKATNVTPGPCSP